MRRFAALAAALETATAAPRRREILAAYLRSSPPGDAAWALYLLGGGELPRLASPRQLRAWAAEASGLPEWLVAECQAAAGDLAEMAALLGAAFPGRAPTAGAELPLARWMEERVVPLRDVAPVERGRRVRGWWSELGVGEAVTLHRILARSRRLAVAAAVVADAAADAWEVPRLRVARWLAQAWWPSERAVESLRSGFPEAEAESRPGPRWAEASGEELALSGPVLAHWLPRGRLVHLRRDETMGLWWWSAGEPGEPVEPPAGAADPGPGLPPESILVGVVAEAGGGAPFVALDLLRLDSEDLRDLPLAERLRRLDALLEAPGLSGVVGARPGPAAPAAWPQALAAARGGGDDALLLRRPDDPSAAAATWWRLAVPPEEADLVLLYARAGHGGAGGGYDELTLGARTADGWVPVARVGTDGAGGDVARRLANWIRRHTTERFGPVRAVEPGQVVRVAFSRVLPAPRRKAGVEILEAHLLAWHEGRPPETATTLEELLARAR